MIDDQLISELRERFTRTADWEYFFDNLSTADWADPLFAAGLFGEPYGPVYDDDNLYFQLPTWPPSLYLARVAKDDPEGIASVAAKIHETRNTRVHHDLIRVFAVAPAETLLAQLPAIQSWLHSTLVPDILLEPAVEVVLRLAHEGHVDEALKFLWTWLTPPEASWPDDWRAWSPGMWEFGEVLNRTAPTLTTAEPLGTLRTLVALLATIQRAEIGRDPVEDPSDSSSGWRSAIEEHAQNRVPFDKTPLLLQLRDVARMAAQGSCEALERVVEVLRAGRWRIFDRVALNTVRESVHDCPQLTGHLLCDRDLLEDVDVYHEYAALLGERFGSLEEDDRTLLSGWLLEGPDLGSLREREAPIDEEWLEKYSDDWRARRLQLIEPWLSAPQRRVAEELWQRMGRLEHPDFLMWSSGVMTGPNSPLDDDVLEAMSVDGIFEFLANWEPEAGFMLPSREGLGRALARALESRPDAFLARAEGFIGQRPNYVRAVFDGVRGLLGGPSVHPSDAEWAPILNLAQWVVDQPVGDVVDDAFEEEVSWVNSRKEIAHVLDAAIRQKRIPAAMASQIWRVIGPLLEDEQPTPEAEATALGPNMDPGTLAINTVRATAVRAAFQYLQWDERRNVDDSQDAVVFEALDQHLDPARDPSMAVRSVFGASFPWVMQKLPAWTVARADIIFPLTIEDRPLFEAAWAAYLAGCLPGQQTGELLRRQYEFAIGLLGTDPAVTHPSGSLSTVEQLLGHHLVWLHLTGSIRADDPLIEAFYQSASPELRASVAEFVGRTFLQGQPPSPELWNRVREWWTIRKRISEASGDLTELGKFVWWTGAARVDPEWFLAELESLLRQGVVMDTEYFVIQTLADISGAYPREALGCLRLIEAHRRSPWLFLGHADAVRRILSSALQMGDEATREAQALIDLLAAKGQGDFGDIQVA